MRFIVEKDYKDASKCAADIFAEQLRKKPNLVCALPTGSTPEGMYAELVRMYTEEGLDFSKMISFAVDEYIPLPPDHPQSYYRFVYERLYSKINIDLKNTFIEDVQRADLDSACAEYESLIQGRGGLDIAYLGIGHDGHIGFNVPAEVLGVRTNVVTLNSSTITANARFFDSVDQVPRRAMTIGMGTILSAKKIVLIASGGGKAKIISELRKSTGVTTRLPATFLLLHNDATIICDQAAAGEL